MTFTFPSATAALLLTAFGALAESDPYVSATEETTAKLSDAATGKKKAEGAFGSVALGYLATSGNTENANLNAKLALGYLAGRWRHVGMAKAIRGSDDGTVNAQEYNFNEQSDYSFTKNNYAFGALDYTSDRFGAYRRRASATIGYGRRLIDIDAHTLDLQAGVGVRQSRQPDDESAQEETIGALAGKYDWKIAAHSDFSQRLAVEHGADNTYTESISAIKANVQGNLALSVSYSVKHNSDVAPDREQTDTATAVSLIYDF